MIYVDISEFEKDVEAYFDKVGFEDTCILIDGRPTAILTAPDKLQISRSGIPEDTDGNVDCGGIRAV